jgi:biotin carboxylase
VGVLLAARIREEFDLPGPRTELTRRLLDKGLQRRIWTEKGVPGPSWELCHSVDEAMAAVDRFGFPLIVKPADSSGSRGVTKLESSDDELQSAIERAFQFSRNGAVLVEGFMDGSEFTVETFASNGDIKVLAVTEKKKVAGTRGTVACELATPDRPAKTLKSITDAVRDAYRALGYTEGPGHAEVMLMHDDTVGLIEVAGRGGGFMVFDRFVPKVSGVNVARLTALQAVGHEVGEIVAGGGSCVLRFFPARSGTIKSISGFEKANELRGVEAESFVEEGASLQAAHTDGDRLGYILSCAETPYDAQEQANKAESCIHYEIG